MKTQKLFKTKTDPVKHFFLRSDDRELFYPLGPFLFFGASWAVVVPTDAMQRSLERDVRVYAWMTLPLGLIATAYLFAHGVGRDIFVLAAWLVPLIIWSMFVKRRVRVLARIPSSESVLLLARHLGQEKLWQQVFLGFFGFAGFAFFFVGNIIKKQPWTFPGWQLAWLLAAFFLANSILALRGLRMLRKDHRPT